jgi:hypothetical protein
MILNLEYYLDNRYLSSGEMKQWHTTWRFISPRKINASSAIATLTLNHQIKWQRCVKRNAPDHQKRKNESRKEKEKDKEQAEEEQHVHTVMFDMEAVLATSNSQVSQVHCKQKFAINNITMYSLTDAEAACYVRQRAMPGMSLMAIHVPVLPFPKLLLPLRLVCYKRRVMATWGQVTVKVMTYEDTSFHWGCYLPLTISTELTSQCHSCHPLLRHVQRPESQQICDSCTPICGKNNRQHQDH